MSNDSLASSLTRRMERSPRERIARAFFAACALLSVLTTVGIIFALVIEAVEFFRLTGSVLGIPTAETVPVERFLTGTTWSVSTEEFGVLAPVTATIMLTLGSALIALPLGIATAIYLSEYASKRKRAYLKPALEVLAGIPTVVYGFFALVYITPALDSVLPVDLATFNLLSACIVVGIMIIPMVSSISEDAMSAVPDELRQAGYGLGATKFEVSTGIVVPAAISGIASAFILALSRAIGETMAVTIAAGTRSVFHNPLDPSAYFGPNAPMTAAMVNIATGDIAAQGVKYRSMFALGLTLFVITLVMNVVSDLIARRYREVYE